MALRDPARPFSKPWQMIEHPEAFEVQDSAQRSLAYVYFTDDPNRANFMRRLSKDGARRMAQQILRAAGTGADRPRHRSGRGLTCRGERRRMGWDRAFDFPVPGCRTFKDAASYIMKLPAKQQREPHWQFAGEVLINAAERGGGWTMLAHMAMLRAMNFGKPSPDQEPRRKAPKKFNIVR